MLILIALIACAGPLLGVAAVAAHSRWRGVALTNRRLILSGVCGGMLALGLVGLIPVMAPRGQFVWVLIVLVIGGAFGALVGGVAVMVWRGFKRPGNGAA